MVALGLVCVVELGLRWGSGDGVVSGVWVWRVEMKMLTLVLREG